MLSKYWTRLCKLFGLSSRRPCDDAREAARELVEPAAPPASICARRRIWISSCVRPREVSGIEPEGEAIRLGALCASLCDGVLYSPHSCTVFDSASMRLLKLGAAALNVMNGKAVVVWATRNRAMVTVVSQEAVPSPRVVVARCSSCS